MALGSDAARNAVLDSSLTGTDAPATLYLSLWAGDPGAGGVEITGGGYARVAVAKSAWGPAAAGIKANSAVLTFPVSTGPWTGTATYGALMSAATAGNRWDTGALGASVSVAGGGTTVTFAAGALTVSEA